MKDLALDSNGLPPPLKTDLINLGAWSMRYSTLAILQDLPLEPLADVNQNIADGLALQAVTAAPIGRETQQPLTTAQMA